MNGAAYYVAVQSLVSGFSIDSVLFYQMLNTARIRREMMRAWMVFRKYQYTQTVNAQGASLSMPPPASLQIPTDFMFFSRDGEITLYNSSGQFETYLEIPLNLAIPYLQASNMFFMDYNAGLIYLMGAIAANYTAFIQYQANLGDITATTTWQNVPTAFQMILAYDVAAMYRLGIDYDDINARNAERNAQDAELLYGAMVQWDDNRQRSSTTRMNMPPITDVPGANFEHRVPVNDF